MNRTTTDFSIDLDVDGLLALIYSLEESKEHRKAACASMFYIEMSLSHEWHARPNKNESKYGFPFIAELLEKLDVTKLSGNCMVGIIRSTYRVKECFLDWEPTLNKIKGEMIRRNMDYKSLLIGLI